MYNIKDIIAFVEQETGCSEIIETTDIEKDLGCYGDDFDDFIHKYSKLFNVEMTSYLWYFHSREEGQNFGKLFFKAPNKRVTRIPVTPFMLLNFATEGKWNIEYPIHSIPQKRYDLSINKFLFILVSAYAIYYWFIR